MKQWTKEQLRPLNDRIYELIDKELGGLKSENETDTLGSEYETVDDYNAHITYEAIQTVLKEVENSLVLAWYSDPSQYFL